MKFECGDLERALGTPDLMPDALAHAKTCPACRRELRLWNEISRTASQLHEEWDSPGLWPRIREALQAEPRPARPHSPGREVDHVKGAAIPDLRGRSHRSGISTT